MTVHFIGAGPGAADLITLRGLRLIQSCPVCLYAGSLVPPELLAVTTDFEAAFHAEGKGTLYAAWRRTDRALPPVERRTGAVLVPEADTGAPLGA